MRAAFCERIASQAQPGCVWMVEIHHLPPHRARKAVVRLAIPGNLCHLERLVFPLIEHRSAEHHAQRDLPGLQHMEVLRRRDIEVECAGKLEIDEHAVAESRRGDTCVHPQQRTHRPAPSLGFAEQVEKLLLFGWHVAPARWLNLNLASLGYRVNSLGSRIVCDSQLQRKQRCGSVLNCFGAFDGEVQFRHEQASAFQHFSIGDRERIR